MAFVRERRRTLFWASGRGHPELSPDSRWLLVRTHTLNDVAELRVVEVATGALLPETVLLGAGGLPADRGLTLGRVRWSPEGRAVSFLRRSSHLVTAMGLELAALRP